MPLRKEPPTPRTAAVAARLDVADPNHTANSTLAPLIPFKPGQTSLRQQAILTEDEYTSALSSVIKRDFFPDLDRITAENEYLAAVEVGEPGRMRVALERLVRFDRKAGGSAETKVRAERGRSATPRAASGSTRGEWDDTPIASSSSRIFNPTFTPASAAASTPAPSHLDQTQDPELTSGIEPDLDLSLAQFQSRYTSEDNASFSQLLDRDNQIRKRKHAHLFARERSSEQRRRHIIEAEERDAQKGKQLAMEANPEHPKLLEQAKTTLLIEGSEAEGAEKEPSGTDPMDDLILVPEPRHDNRPPPMGLNRWRYTARNALMYAADANEPYLHTRPSPIAATNDQDAPKPTTNFSALRLPDQSDPAAETRDVEPEESDSGWSPSSSRVDEAIRRGRAGSFTSSSFGAAADETPKVNGYGFVTPYSTPQHGTPRVGEEDDDVHLRIYNAIKAKRRTHVSSSAATATTASASGGGFQLPRVGRREELAHKLASPKNSAGGATPYGKAKYAGLSGLRASAFASPHNSSRRSKEKVGGLTPAARALLERSTRGVVTPTATMALPAARRDRGLANRGWTPTPRRLP